MSFYIIISVKVKEAAPVEIQTPNTAGGVYIPPSKRNQPAGGSSSSSSSAARSRTGNFGWIPSFHSSLTHFTFPGKKEKGAPDLANEEYFPTLSAAVAIEQNNFKLKKYLYLFVLCQITCLTHISLCYFTGLNKQSAALLRLNPVDPILIEMLSGQEKTVLDFIWAINSMPSPMMIARGNEKSGCKSSAVRKKKVWGEWIVLVVISHSFPPSSLWARVNCQQRERRGEKGDECSLDYFL